MSAPRSLRAHVQDAAFHIRSAHRSLEAAAVQAQTRRGERKLSRLASETLRWAVELDPYTHWRREHRHQTPRQPTTGARA